MTAQKPKKPHTTALAHRQAADLSPGDAPSAQVLAPYVPPTADEIRLMLCPKANDRELELFRNICIAEELNPFMGDIFLIKYSDNEPAATVIAAKVYLKAAENSPNYDGHEAGIILKVEGSSLPVFREGTFMLQGEVLVGGWARVYRKDRTRPFYVAVPLAEVRKVKADGQPNKAWRTEPANMVRKVSLHRALRESFPNRFGQVLTTTEAMEDGEFREAFTGSDGELEWNKWWPRQFAKGLTEVQIHEILGVESVKEWLDAGKTLEDADTAINAALAKKSKQLTMPTDGQKAKDEAKMKAEQEKALAAAKAARQKTIENLTELAEKGLGAGKFGSFVLPEIETRFMTSNVLDLDEAQLVEIEAWVKEQAAANNPVKQRELRIEFSNCLIKEKGMTVDDAKEWVKKNLGRDTTAGMTVPELEAAIEKARTTEVDIPI